MASANGDTPTPNKRCLDCGYILGGLPENRCPECGRPFDPNDPQTYDPHGLAGQVFSQAATWAAWLAVPAALLMLLQTFASAIPNWVLALAAVLAFVGLSIAIVVVGASGRRLLSYGRGTPEDWTALRKAFVVGLVTLIVVVIVVLLMVGGLR